MGTQKTNLQGSSISGRPETVSLPTFMEGTEQRASDLRVGWYKSKVRKFNIQMFRKHQQ